MQREDESAQAARVLRALLERGDGRALSRALSPHSPRREAICGGAPAAQWAAARSDDSTSGGSSSGPGRSWADQSEDAWPTVAVDLAPAGGNAASARHQVGGLQLPSFGNRLFAEFLPAAGRTEPPSVRQELPKSTSRSALRRRMRERKERRAEVGCLNLECADRAIAAALECAECAECADRALAPRSAAVPPWHLDFPRSEAESPRRPPAPWPTPRPHDRRKALQQEE